MSINPHPKWISDFGFINSRPNQKQSENGILFDVEHKFLWCHNTRPSHYRPELLELLVKIEDLWKTNGGKYKTLPDEDSRGGRDRFSLDNMIAVAAFLRFCIDNDIYARDARRSMEYVIFSPYYYRFYDVIPFLLLMKFPTSDRKNRITRFLQSVVNIFMLGLVWFFTIVPCFIYGPRDTSGRLLAYVKCRGLGSRKLYNICEFVMKLRGLSFKKSFAIYFPFDDHPNTAKARLEL